METPTQIPADPHAYGKLVAMMKKLKALARQGAAGERENASELLNRLMRKYNITESDICEQVPRRRAFSVKKDEEAIFKGVVFSVLNVPELRYTTLRGQRTKAKTVFIDMTDAQYIEVVAKSEFYQAAWRRELPEHLSRLQKAFIIKNQLHSQVVPDGPRSPRTPEQQAEDARVLDMTRHVGRHEYLRQIEAPSE